MKVTWEDGLLVAQIVVLIPDLHAGSPLGVVTSKLIFRILERFLNKDNRRCRFLCHIATVIFA
jgi:hypothetical protein